MFFGNIFFTEFEVIVKQHKKIKNIFHFFFNDWHTLISFSKAEYFIIFKNQIPNEQLIINYDLFNNL